MNIFLYYIISIGFVDLIGFHVFQIINFFQNWNGSSSSRRPKEVTKERQSEIREASEHFVKRPGEQKK